MLRNDTVCAAARARQANDHGLTTNANIRLGRVGGRKCASRAFPDVSAGIVSGAMK